MSEKYKEVARRFLNELWNQSNFDVVDELLAHDYDGHYYLSPCRRSA